jgi:hypothetical protein
MAKSGEFYSFDEVLRRLSIDENRLKRLVSEGEIRAFREGDQMKFKKGEIDNLAGKGAGETLTDDLLEEPDLTKRGGMKTAEISSQDTFIDKGGDQVGMSTEPIDFTEEVAGEEPEQIGAEAAATKRAKAGTATAVRKPPLVTAEARTHPLLVVALVLGSLASIWALMVVISISKKQPQEGISETAMKAFFSPPDGR